MDGVVAGILNYVGSETLDARGRYLVPGFVDAHVHLESSKLLVDEFARLVLPLGTTAVVADPHEIANVLGTDGVHWLIDACEQIPLEVYFMASSCVPASEFESPWRELTIGDLEGLLHRHRAFGLAEMMNFPGVISGSPSELAKLALARHVDGHAPGVRGHQLNAYAAAGIRSDHEASTAEEGRERLRAGLWLLIREASAARNLEALIPLAREYGPSRIAFCTDDREPGGEIVTASLVDELGLEDGYAVADPARDLAKVAVLERHLGTGRIGLGFVRGFGIQRGAFGATLSHHAHNVIVGGVDDGAMALAVARLRELGGGIGVADEEDVRAELPLPVAGLLSDRPLSKVLDASRGINGAAQALGVTFPAPFQMLAFLALSVIPSLKITDRGLLDVDRCELVPLAVDGLVELQPSRLATPASATHA